jgi:hypothetical protein
MRAGGDAGPFCVKPTSGAGSSCVFSLSFNKKPKTVLFPPVIVGLDPQAAHDLLERGPAQAA